ncbi:MAG: L,D-transpeptidase family protein [Kiritimatiellaeota bacterium]|nr:L,D-transpeptidase family protein [Kiritimatiellota bacterium]
MGLVLVAVALLVPWQRACALTQNRLRAPASVAERVKQYGGAARARLMPQFVRVAVAYPPRAITLVGLKAEKRCEVWVSGDGKKFQLLTNYPIRAASGVLGPKLREGDQQVPEGLYRIESLNPNSLYHLSLRVNYPNDFDRQQAKAEGRTRLGGDIMIHGSDVSIGCIALGDAVAEDLFVLVAETGIKNISVILAPVDFRVRQLPPDIKTLPAWAPALYAAVRKELAYLPAAALK